MYLEIKVFSLLTRILVRIVLNKAASSGWIILPSDKAGVVESLIEEKGNGHILSSENSGKWFAAIWDYMSDLSKLKSRLWLRFVGPLQSSLY